MVRVTPVGQHRSGTFTNGMEFQTWGAGPKSLLFLPGGPGSAVPTGLLARMSRSWFGPLVEDGYAVWYATRRRNMPAGHSIADMADDCAQAIREDLGGRVDLVVGQSFGGMIAQYLAARHADSLERLAIVVAAAKVSEWGRGVDARLAAAIARRDTRGVGRVFAEYALPGERSRWARRLVGPWVGRTLLSGKHYPPADLLVETRAELSFDARPVLPDIKVPVGLFCGDRDRFFPQDVVEETVRLIPECTRFSYPGQGHAKVASGRRVVEDVLAFVHDG